ncbi:hypothetical protein KFK09_005940 [Dendrobium nobile]|uniref:Uncharacterized protein n=1 Tax=Dendrobium nobile TaxID=94219 RepID=A0A8T3C2G5_DENNO|nr:hypothetical protein KFK09_005940 [Dendrobium nobile]
MRTNRLPAGFSSILRSKPDFTTFSSRLSHSKPLQSSILTSIASTLSKRPTVSCPEASANLLLQAITTDPSLPCT